MRFGRPFPDGGTIGVVAAAILYDSRSDVLRLPLGVTYTFDADANALIVDEPALR